MTRPADTGARPARRVHGGGAAVTAEKRLDDFEQTVAELRALVEAQDKRIAELEARADGEDTYRREQAERQ